MGEDIVDATPERVMAVIQEMRSLRKWPEDPDDRIEWEIDGLEGHTSFFAHCLVLGATPDARKLAALTGPLLELGDARWRAHQQFDAALFTDDASTDPMAYDRRSALADVIRALDSDAAVYWPLGSSAVVLVDNSGAAPATAKAAVFVLPVEWVTAPTREERALQVPLVRDFVSGDSDRVRSALWSVVRTRDPKVLMPLVAALPAIKRETADAELGGMLASNNAHLEHALARVELFRKGTCLCAAYLSHQFYDPAKEEHLRHVRIVGTVPNPRQWEPDRICECRDCGQRFQVEQGEYHYTWWKWTRLT